MVDRSELRLGQHVNVRLCGGEVVCAVVDGLCNDWVGVRLDRGGYVIADWEDIADGEVEADEVVRTEIPKDLEVYAQSVEDYYDVGEERGYLCTHRGDIKDAVIAGAEWYRERMMKDAVEAIVEDWNPDPEPEITIPLNPEEFTLGDKVRVIIVKED